MRSPTGPTVAPRRHSEPTGRRLYRRPGMDEHVVPDLAAAAAAVDVAEAVIGTGVRRLAETGGPDANQVLAYDVAHAASATATARSVLEYGSKGDVEARIACA